MPPMSESEFPTIAQLRDRLSELVDKGFGALPVQIVVVPDSTLQAIARSLQPTADRPALMIDLTGADQRMAVGLISIDRLSGRGMPTTSLS
jgi:hypothetical protein